MRRLLSVFAAIIALMSLSGCLAVQTVGVAAGAAGAAVGVAGDVAEGAVKVVLPGDGEDDEDGDE